jgi:hypothetical protein
VLGGERARKLERCRGVVGEHAQDAQLLLRRQEPILGIVRPDEADRLAVLGAQRRDEPVAVPRPRPAAVHARLIVRLCVAALHGIGERQQVTAFDLEPLVGEAVEVRARELRAQGRFARRPAGERGGRESAAVVEEDPDAVEAERARDALRDRL